MDPGIKDDPEVRVTVSFEPTLKMAPIGDQLLNRLKCQHFHKLVNFTDDVTVVSKDTFLI